ncbi:MAG: AbrB/MazE/SpoVT family DNA-binding domain-containing protein [Gammaproteobacteria bacterium]|nr:AbrB/MazE/SpoVT family DNA-binding domain-containing protein [Gammaproteobacteria bacterium]
MHTAKLFANGKSQAVRLPKEFRFEGNEVVVKRLGSAVLLFPARYNAKELKSILDSLDPDFQITRDQPKRQQKRRRLRAR